MIIFALHISRSFNSLSILNIREVDREGERNTERQIDKGTYRDRVVTGMETDIYQTRRYMQMQIESDSEVQKGTASGTLREGHTEAEGM